MLQGRESFTRPALNFTPIFVEPPPNEFEWRLYLPAEVSLKIKGHFFEPEPTEDPSLLASSSSSSLSTDQDETAEPIRTDEEWQFSIIMYGEGEEEYGSTPIELREDSFENVTLINADKVPSLRIRRVTVTAVRSINGSGSMDEEPGWVKPVVKVLSPIVSPIDMAVKVFG